MPDCASANVRTVATVYVPVPLSEGAAGLVVVLLFTRRLPVLVGASESNMTVTRRVELTPREFVPVSTY